MKKLTQSDLDQFRGGDEKYTHWLRRLVFSEGVQYMAECAGAYWLIDIVASYQMHKKVKNNKRLQEFQLWELKVKTDKNGGKSAVVTLREDTGEPVVIRQKIEYTDFPLDYIKLYVEGGTLLLPSEH
jgi:hypothetical protein